MATSGTVSAYSFNLGKVIEHAFRRAGMIPEQLGGEAIEVAKDLVYSLTSEWVAAGFPLWTRKYYMLNTPIGSPDVTLPSGTVDILHSYWRIFNPYRGTATTSAGDDASDLFSGQAGTDVTITGPNAAVLVDFGTQTEVDYVGILLGGAASATAAVQIQTSEDGVTYTTAQTLESTTFEVGKWSYFDLNPTLSVQYIKIVFPTGTWALQQLNLCLANSTDVMNGPLNIDDYYNLPNRVFRSNRPNSAFMDRVLPLQTLKVWPVLNEQGFYNGVTTVLARRYIEDPGDLTDDVEVPQRWLEALIWRLSSLLIVSVPVPNQTPDMWQARLNMLEQKATKAEMIAWAEERVKAPIRWSANVSCYTR